jgi:hypothetical protein
MSKVILIWFFYSKFWDIVVVWEDTSFLNIITLLEPSLYSSLISLISINFFYTIWENFAIFFYTSSRFFVYKNSKIT